MIVGDNRVSCVVTIVIKNQLDGINLFTEDHRVFTRETGLVGNPVTPCDVIRVYTKMNENFKGGINNVMVKNNDLTDSRYHQRCADNGHRSLVHTSVRGKPIREKGRFGYSNTPDRDADWSVEYSVGVIQVGAIRIGYLRDPVNRRQSTDAAPLTSYLYSTRFFISTIVVLQDLLGVGISAIQCGITFVWKNLHGVVVIFQCVRQ